MTCLEQAKKGYKELTNILREVCDVLREFKRTTGGASFEAEDVLQKFDIVLQYGLVRNATCDGKLVPEEEEIIEKIAEYGSLADLVNIKFNMGPDKFVLKRLTTMDARGRDLVLQIIEEDVKRYALSIATIMGVVAAASGRDLVSEMYNPYSAIIAAVYNADGNVDQREVNQMLNDWMQFNFFLKVDKETMASKNR